MLSEIIATEAAMTHEMQAVTPASMAALRWLGSALALAGRSPVPYPSRSSLGSSGRFLRGMAAPYDHRGITLTRPTRAFSGRLELDIGGRKVELIEVGPAHTHGDLIVHVPDARTVFAADVAFIGSTPVMWVGPLDRWLRALDVIEALEPEVVIPGHGPVTDVAGLATLRAYWAFLEAGAERRLAAGLTPEAAARDRDLRGVLGAAVRTLGLPRARGDQHPYARSPPKRRIGAPRAGRRQILAAVGQLAAELPGRAPAVLHPPT